MASSDNLNKSYETDPITKAVIEIRFTPNDDLAANFIFTALYNKVKSDFPRKKETGVTSLPKEVFNADPGFRYQPHFVLSGEGKAINIGSYSLAIICTKPYMGWASFQGLVQSVFTIVKDLEVIKSVDRVGLRYTNMLDKSEEDTVESQFSQIDCDLRLGSLDLIGNNTGIRTEFERKGFTIISQISSGATDVQSERNGVSLLVDIDVIKQGLHENYWDGLMAVVNEAHDIEKDIFFDIVKTETMEKYDN